MLRPLPEVPAGAWPLFLASERCARPLSAGLDAAGASGALPPEAADALRDRLEAETRRVLMARSRLAALAEVAREGGFRPVVLKGGVLLLDEGALDLGDLDVLLPRARAEPFARELERRGYRRGPGHGSHHLEPLSGDGPVPVEVHFRLPVAPVSGEEPRGAVEPLPGADGLFRLAPSDHLWHLLHHGVVEHPNRRGRIRDLLLTARALGRCGDGEARAVVERAAAHPASEPLLAQLGMARSLADGEAPGDAFRAEAASHYLLWALLRPRGLPRAFTVQLFDAAVERLGSAVDRRRAWRQLAAFPEGVSEFGWIGAVERRLPALGRAWRLGLRVARRALAALLALPVARWARGAARGGAPRS